MFLDISILIDCNLAGCRVQSVYVDAIRRTVSVDCHDRENETDNRLFDDVFFYMLSTNVSSYCYTSLNSGRRLLVLSTVSDREIIC